VITPEQVHTLALQAGAARFYPEQQAVKQELYLVSQGFLEKFAELVEKHKLEQELEQTKVKILRYTLAIATRKHHARD
jgi:NAD dependent epimerase/dehydratase family enzyme